MKSLNDFLESNSKKGIKLQLAFILGEVYVTKVNRNTLKDRLYIGKNVNNNFKFDDLKQIDSVISNNL